MEFKEDIIQGVLNASPNNDDPERHFQELMQLTPESIPVDPIKSVFDSTEMYYGDTIPEGLVSEELSPDLAAERGLRYHFAMGSRSPGLDQMSFDLMQGKEGQIREGEYLNRILEDKTMRSKLIDEIISTGKEPDQETIDFVSNLSNNEVLEASHSPGTIMEKMATEKLMSNALANPIDDEYLISVNQDIPDSVIDWSNRGTTYSLIARKYVEDQNKILEQQGWGSFLLDLGENFIPFLEWYRLSDVTELGSDTSFLLGNNLQDQVAEMYLLPTAEEFDAKFKETMDKLNEVNPQTAMQFAMAVMGYSTTDRFLSNTFSTLDLTTLATPAVAAASRLKGVAQAAGSATTRSLAAKMAATAGNQADLAQAVVEKAGKTGRISDFNDMMMQVPSIHNPGAILRDPQGLLSTTADEAARLKNILEGQSAALVKGIIVDPIKLDRLTPEQRVAAYAAAREKFDEVYPHMNTAVIDVKPIDGLEETLHNVDAIAIEIGSPSGKLFGSERLARTYAKQYGIAQPVIKRKGEPGLASILDEVTDQKSLEAAKLRVNKEGTQADKDYLKLLKLDTTLYNELKEARKIDDALRKQLRSDKNNIRLQNQVTSSQEKIDSIKFQLEANDKVKSEIKANINKLRADKELLSTKGGIIALGKDYVEISKQVEDILNKTLPKGWKGQVTDRIFDFSTFSELAGSANPKTRIVMIAMKTLDPVATAYHEVGHALRNTGLIPESDWQILRAKAIEIDARKLYDIDRKYSNSYKKFSPEDRALMLEEEDVMHMIGDRASGKNFGEVVNRILDRVNKVFRQVVKVVTRNGERTFDDVIEDIKNGAFLDNTPNPTDLAKKMSSGEYFSIKDRNGGFYIEVIQHVDETDPRVLNALKVSTSVTPPDSVLNRFAGWFRSKDDLVSEEIAKDYAVSAMSSKGMLNAAKQIRRTIEDLPGASTLDKWLGKSSSRQDFETFIKSEQTWTKNGQNGKYSNTLLELESNWRKQFSRLPTEQEKLAYFSYIQLNDIDLVVRNLNMRRDRIRIGMRSVSIQFGTNRTGFFEAKPLTEFPMDIPENAGILIWDGDPGTKPIFRSKNFTKAEVFEDLKKQGYKLLHLSPYGEADFRDHVTNLVGRTKIDDYLPPKARIHYMYVKQFDDKVLPFKQIPRNPGGHHIPQDPWVVRQVNISTNTIGGTTESVYYGDRNLFSAGSRLEAEKMAELINTARIMLRNSTSPSSISKPYVSLIRNSAGDESSKVGETATGKWLSYFVRDEDGKNIARFEGALISDGKPVRLKDGKVQNYNTFFVTQFDSLNSSNRISPKHIRGIIKEIKKEFPQAEYLRGERVSGFREFFKKGDKDTGSISIKNIATDTIRSVDFTEVKNFVESNLAVSFSTFKRKMTDLDSPVLVTPVNQSAWKTHNISALHDQATGKLLYPNLRNDKENGHNVYKGQVDLEFASERGETMFSLQNTGTLDNPVFNFKRGDLIDPIPSMDRTLSSLLKGVVLDDMKRKSTTQFVEVFADVLDGDLADMRRNPYATLLAPKWKTSVPGEKRNLLAAAKNYRRATLEFLNLETEAQRDSNVILQKFSDSITSKLGLQRKDVTHKYEWFKDTDPVSYLRGWVFDAKMGFFSPVQMPLQAITSFHAMAVEGPVRGGQALANAFLLRAALARPSMLDGVATKAMGMTKEQFTESFNMMKRMNWDNVGYEVSNLDAMMSSGVVESAVDRGREAGRFFFKQGEQWTRLVAWNAASLRWYADNPGQKMGVRAAQEVLKRADLLSVNMTSASNASWQKGIASIPTQFSAYPMRLAEQLMPGLSGRLTPMEKTKAFLTYSILFGVPFAASGTVGVWPIHKEIRQQLLERGVDVDEGSIAKYMSDGILGSLVDWVGDRDWNASERFGPSGTPLFSDLITGDNTFTETLLGATGSTIGDTVKAMLPFAWSVTSIFSDNDETYPLTMSDFHNLASTITTYSLAQKAWAVYNTGNYVGRSGVVLDEDLNSWDAFVVGLTGMQTQRTSDAFILQKSDRDLRDLQQNARKEITKNLDMMFKSEDDEERINYAKRAKAWYKAGGFRPDQAPAILSGVGDQKSLSDKAEENFSKRSPEDQKRYLEKIIRRQGNN